MIGDYQATDVIQRQITWVTEQLYPLRFGVDSEKPGCLFSATSSRWFLGRRFEEAG